MSSEMSDEEWIERFNEFSREFYYQRYKAMFKPTSSIRSIILPSDRHEIKVGINHLTKEDKEKIKSMKNFSQQVLGLIAILEEPIKHYYDIMQQDFIEKAIKYYSDGVDINRTSDSSNIGIQLVNHIILFCDDKFTFEDATKIIERNQEKYENNIINRLLSSIVPILVKKREEIETKEDIENVIEEFMKHDLDMMVMDVATWMDEMSSTNNIYPKTCGYGYNTQIYWNTSVNEYWEVLTQKKHICPNRPGTISIRPPATSMTTTNTRPFFTVKNPGVLNQKCLIPLSYCTAQ